MKPVSPHIMFNNCYGRYAIAAVNVFTMEQVLSVFAAASEAESPVIVQITPTARNYAHPVMMYRMVQAAAEIYDDVVYALHLDHGTESHVFDAIDAGYTSVMIDASHEEFETNVARTKTVVERARAKQIFVEAELGVLSGVEDDLSIDANHARYTDPQQASEFVNRTGCDSLAIAVGTSHGAYKFSGNGGIRFDILGNIQNTLPGFPLVLHGSSGVRAEDVAEINRFGGRLSANFSGVSDDDLRRAISMGICKVNLATDLRLIWTRVHRRFFAEEPEQFDPLVPGRDYKQACKEYLVTKFHTLNSCHQSVNLTSNHI